MGAAIGFWAALALAAPAASRPINLNLPPPRPPAQATLPPNFLAPVPVRPAWLAPWLFPDPSKATYSGGRHGGGGGGHGAGRFFGGGHGHGGNCHGGGHH
jgi:hypothetical protein